MRIAVICGAPYVSGKEKIMLGLLKIFKKQGLEVLCITSKWNDGMFTRALKESGIPFEEVHIGFLSVVLKWSVIKMVLDQFRRIPNLYYDYSRVIRAFKPDIIVHTNFHTTFLLYPLLSKSVYNIYHSHESIIYSKFYRRLFALFDSRIHLFIGVSNFVSERLIQLGLPKEKIKTIYNGADINVSVKPIKSSVLRIGIVGQIVEWKGHSDLIDALGILNALKIEFKCSIYGQGNGEFVSALKHKIQVLHMDDRIEWQGYVSNQDEIYNNLDVACVPSQFEEPFGLAAFEPGLYGLPVIATQRGGLPEIVIDGLTGFLVPVKSPKAIADKLQILANNQYLRCQLGDAAREFVEKKFDIDRINEQWQRVFMYRDRDSTIEDVETVSKKVK